MQDSSQENTVFFLRKYMISSKNHLILLSYAKKHFKKSFSLISQEKNLLRNRFGAETISHYFSLFFRSSASKASAMEAPAGTIGNTLSS